jgi:hypothetical protein
MKETYIKCSIYKEVVAHAAALVLLRHQNIVKHPEDWLEAQINGYRSYIDDIRRRFQRVLIFEDVRCFLESVNKDVESATCVDN